MLGRYAAAVCRECGGECCRRIGCEFFSSRFASCPVLDYRPAKCRLYFCHRILESEALSEEERRMLNAPAVQLSSALKQGYGLGIFIEPPLRIGDKSWLTPLGIEGGVKDVINRLEQGTLNAESARASLLQIVLRCRSGLT